MGLRERRAIKAFEDTQWPELKAQILDAAGAPIPIEVDWASLAAEGYADDYAESLPKLYFLPLIQAFKNVAFDDLGKEAVREGIARIIIQNKAQGYSSWWVNLQDKVLTLDHYYSNIDDVEGRTEVLQKKLENQL